jgi:hypothetical protein
VVAADLLALLVVLGAAVGAMLESAHRSPKES